MSTRGSQRQGKRGNGTTGTRHRPAKGLQRLIDTLPAVVVHLNTDYRIRFANRQFRKWFGLDPETMIGRHVGEAIGQAAFDTLRAYCDQALSGRTVVHHGEVCYGRGGTRFIHGTYVPSHDEAGEVDGLYVLALDLTGEHSLQWLLAGELERSQTIIDNAIDGIITIDSKGIICTFNPAAEKIFGYRASEVIGCNVNVLMPEPDRSRHGSYICNYQRTGQAKIIGIGREVTGRRKDGTLFELQLAVAEIKHGGRFFVGFTQDISMLKQAEREARERFAELAHMDRLGALGAVATGLAHELSQPLTAIAATVEACFISLKYTESAEPALVRALEQISRQGQRARDIIGQHRGYLRGGQTGSLEIHDPKQLVDDVLALLKYESDAAGVTIRLDMDPAVDGCLVNRVRIEQVLFNLAKNAIDALHDWAGERELAVSSRADGQFCEISVADTGPGIPAENIERLFNPFFTTKAGGLGQGLSICNTIVHQHGGTLTAGNRPGGGAVFRFTLPVRRDGDE